MRFGTRSTAELQGVRAELVICATEALGLVASEGLDFSVFDGLRTEAEQRRNIRRGVSWTMNSLHLPQSDGLAWAVDLVPYINGKLMWDNPEPEIQKRIEKCFYLISKGMLEAAAKHGYRVQWGFDIWGKDKPHFQLDGG